ncbi:MAG: HD domain-containing protein [Synechococcaceae cyanobacterium]|nr:HD domain-containing protein [Synechococcaceae cyanobacterium]
MCPSDEATPADVPDLLRALAFAATKHRDQRRKDAEASPYINHPIAVAHVLAVEGGVTDRDILVAAVLHDTVEDTETSFAELEAGFGTDVTRLVRELTDDKSLPKDERKRRQVRHATAASPGAKQIKLADKICNVRDITDTPPADWPVERRLAYLAWAREVVDGCRGTNAALERAFDAALARARRVVTVA